LLTAAVGGAIIYFSNHEVLFAIGVGVIAYAGAVAFYTLLAIWRMRRAALRNSRNAKTALILEAKPSTENVGALTVRDIAQFEGK
jgi:hypothetical protein